VRFREDTPEGLARARAEVAAWRDRNPAGTGDDLVAILGPRFHRDYGRCCARCCSRSTGTPRTRSPARTGSSSGGDSQWHAPDPGWADRPGDPAGQVQGCPSRSDRRRRRVRHYAGPDPGTGRRDGNHPVHAARAARDKLGELLP